jgi:conjugal transfer pilus assembly protein TraA
MTSKEEIMRKFHKLATRLAPAAASVVPVAANAQNFNQTNLSTTNNSVDAFNSFAGTLIGWANSGLGVGLSVAAFLVGAGVGVAKNSALPMLGGVAIAAFLHWGPTILESLAGNGAVLV